MAHSWLDSIDGDEFRILLTFLCSYPLVGLLRAIPAENLKLKHWYILIVSLIYPIYTFQKASALCHMLLTCLATYQIAKHIHGRKMPWLGSTFLMAHLSWLHWRRMSTGASCWVDVSTPQMVLVIKLMAYCWNVYDGRQLETSLTKDQKVKAIRQIPTALEYFSYALFFPTQFAGPGFDYADYRRFISQEMFKVASEQNQAHKAIESHPYKSRIPAGSRRTAVKKALAGLIWLAFSLRLAKFCTTEYLVGPRFAHQSFVFKIVALHIFALKHRTKTYGIWELVNGACVLSGFGFSGFDVATKTAHWDRLQNVRPFQIEFAQNSHAYLGGWNLNTTRWLRNYVYLRIVPTGQKPGAKANMITFIFSAFWHGFYPGYYFTFVLGGLIHLIGQRARRLLRPQILESAKTNQNVKLLYNGFTYAVTQLSFDFAVVPFIALHLPTFMLIWARVYFYGIITAIAAWILLSKSVQVSAGNWTKSTARIFKTFISSRHGALQSHSRSVDLRLLVSS